MNLIGQIGNFIAVYQYEITIALAIMIAVIIGIVLVRTIYNIEKNRKNLEELRETLSEINEKVNRISLKEEMKPAEPKERRGVIYIDNRTSAPVLPDNAKKAIAGTDELENEVEVVNAECDSVSNEVTAEIKEAFGTIETQEREKVIKDAEDAEGENEAETEAANEPEEIIPEVRKYFNRNDFISKNGRKYSKEELEKQIR